MQGYLRQCSRCGAGFAVCRPCDRGRRYCPSSCSQEARAELVRGYRAVQRQTFQGRTRRAARNRALRARKKAAQIETDHPLVREGVAIQVEATEHEVLREEHRHGIDRDGTAAERARDLERCAARSIEDERQHAVERPPDARCCRCGQVVDEWVPDARPRYLRAALVRRAATLRLRTAAR